ncbi:MULTISPECIES: SGNH/GDSL hydrolase family protein [unclassified Luteococcus]|uniref:SGNH/GDSL hydrolase family protein n=1 Tax=unclassified Luteococcus TaxID=2639923 RepID=UPI00313EAD09
MSRIIGADVALASVAVATVALAAIASTGYSVRAYPTSTVSVAAADTEPTPTSSTTPSGGSASRKPPKLPADSVATLGVLGDSTSNSTSEWVNELGSYFGMKRRTEVRRINQGDPNSYNDPMRYGDVDPPLAIWNASTEAHLDLTTDTAKRKFPSPPTLILISQGRDSELSTAPERLSTEVAVLQRTFPKASIAVVLQPVGTDDPKKDVLTAVRSWATEQGLPTIDVDKAFKASGKGEAILEPDGTITADGQVFWASTVYKAISAG